MCKSVRNFREGKKSRLKYQNTRIFTLLKRKPSLEGCWLTFPEFPWQLPYFSLKSPYFSYGFQSGLHSLCCLFTLNNKPCGSEERSCGAELWPEYLLHMHSDPPQCILRKEGQEGSGEGEVLQAG